MIKKKALTFSSDYMVLGSKDRFLFAEERYDRIKTGIKDSINCILFMGIGICLS